MLSAGNTIRVAITDELRTNLNVPYRRLLVYVDGREAADLTIVSDENAARRLDLIVAGKPVYIA